jgi:hypothetical protein
VYAVQGNDKSQSSFLVFRHVCYCLFRFLSLLSPWQSLQKKFTEMINDDVEMYDLSCDSMCCNKMCKCTKWYHIVDISESCTILRQRDFLPGFRLCFHELPDSLDNLWPDRISVFQDTRLVGPLLMTMDFYDIPTTTKAV